MIATNRRFRAAVWSAAFAISVLLGYCVAQGYHRDPELMATIAIVRLGAGYALGAAIAALASIYFVVARTGQYVSRFLACMMMSGSTIVVLLAGLNLMPGT